MVFVTIVEILELLDFVVKVSYSFVGSMSCLTSEFIVYFQCYFGVFVFKS